MCSLHSIKRIGTSGAKMFSTKTIRGVGIVPFMYPHGKLTGGRMSGARELLLTNN